jgi:hypothetical protein
LPGRASLQTLYPEKLPLSELPCPVLSDEEPEPVPAPIFDISEEKRSISAMISALTYLSPSPFV